MTHAAALVALHAAVALFGFAGLFGKWLTLSPVAIVLGRTAIAAVALGILRLRAAHACSVRCAPHRERRRARAPLAQLFRGDPGVDGGRRPARLRELPALHASGRARLLRAPVAPARRRDRAARDGGTRAARARAFARQPGRAGLGLGTRLGIHVRAARRDESALDGNANGHRHRLLAERARRARAAALRVGGACRHRRRSARARSCCSSCWGSRCTALAHTLFIGGLAVVTAHTASVIAALEPVYGIALALAFLGEVPGRARSPAAR